MSEFHDSLEIRSPEDRERDIFSELPGLVRHAKSNAGAYARSLADIDPLEVRDRDALAALPVTRKSEMAGHQAKAPPFGGFAASTIPELARVFLSPGPIFEPQARRDDYWRVARALHAAGVRRGDLLHNSFSYHLTPAGAMLESGAHALGCCVFPGGVGQTEFQVEAMSRLEPQAYAGTPSFLDIILEKAAEIGRDLSNLKKALVSGEALPPSLRAKLQRAGVERVLQCYATAEAGLIAYESEAMEGMIVEEGVLLEIVRPGTGDPVPAGDVGEVLVTVFNPDYPPDPFRHRRSVGPDGRNEPLRADQPAHQGLDGARRPDHQGAGHVRAPEPGGGGAQAPPGSEPGPPRGRQRRQSRFDDPALRDPGRALGGAHRGGRGEPARRMQAARRGAPGRAGRATPTTAR